jgi:heme oxygenase
LLVDDLSRLGIASTTALPRYQLPVFPDVAEALAWIYVVERNTLLHGVIHRHLAHRLPEVSVGGSYLACYDRAAGVRWRELGAALDRVACTTQIADRIVAAANHAFRAQRQWYDVFVPPTREDRVA